MLGHLLLHRLQARKLTFREWGKVTSLSLFVSQRLLKGYIDAGIDVSNTENEQLRMRQLGCWREH